MILQIRKNIQINDNTLITCIAGFLKRFNDSSNLFSHLYENNELTDAPKCFTSLTALLVAFCIFPRI